MQQTNAAQARQKGFDEFLDRLRTITQMQAIVGGFFDSDIRTLREPRISIAPDVHPDIADDLVRRATARLAVFSALRSKPVVDQKTALVPDDPARFPIWTRQGDLVIGIGRPVARIYPVVACVRPIQTNRPEAQELLGMGLAHVAHALTEHVYARPVWPEGLAEATLKMLSIAYFVVNANAEIMHDGRGEDAMDDTAWIVANGRLSLKQENERQALLGAIHGAVSDEQRSSIVSVSVGFGLVRLAVVAPLKSGDQPLALVLFEGQRTDHSALREHFFRAYSLTRSESLTAQEVLNGRSPTEMAEVMGLSVATVRSYLKQVFAKTGTHRQSELISLYYSSILPVGTSIARAGARRQS